MRRALYGAAAAALAFVAGCAPLRGVDPGESRLEGDRYVNRTYSFSLLLPGIEDWEVYTERGEIDAFGVSPWTVVLANSDRGLIHVRVMVEEVSAGTGPGEYLEGAKARLPAQEMEEVSVTTLLVDGYKAVLWKARWRPDKGVEVFYTRLSAVKGDLAYSLIVAAPARVYPLRETAVDAITRSFRFTP